MKKFFVILVVLALTMVSGIAMAEVTMDGSVEFLMRSTKNLTDWNDKAGDSGTYRQTYERVRLGVNAKHDNVKGRIQIENDWDPLGRFEASQGGATLTDVVSKTTITDVSNDAGRLKVREGWIDFNIPGAGGAHVKVGHQFLQLGNGWFFRSGKYGSDAWVVGLPGKNTIAFVNVKVAEGAASQSDDTDAYVLLDVFKIDDKNTVGAYIVNYKERGSKTVLPGTVVEKNTIGLHYNGVVGPVKLQAELDIQSGDRKVGTAKTDLSGNQLVIQATMPMDALTARATVAMGSGDDPNSASENEQYAPFLDKDPHYTLVYEYFMTTAAKGTNTGFANTTAFSIGADYKINKMFTVGADLWVLQAAEKVAIQTGGVADKDLGNEIDVKVNATIYDQLTWNTTIGMFMPGKAYELNGKADDATAIQSVLSYKF